MKRKIWIGVLFLTLLGCRRHKVDLPLHRELLPSQWKSGSSCISSDSLCSHAWWESFGNEELNSYIAQAFGSNFSLQAYAARREGAQAAASLASSSLFPVLDFSVHGTRKRIPESLRQHIQIPNPPAPPPSPGMTSSEDSSPSYTVLSGPGHSSALGSGLRISYEADLWGKIRFGIDAAESRVEATEEDVLAAQLSLSADIARAFFSYLTCSEKQHLVDRALAILDRLICLEEARVSSGLVRKDAVLSYMQMREVQHIEQRALNVQKSQMKTALSVLVGVPLESFSAPKSLFSSGVPTLPERLSSELLLFRPDIRSLYREACARSSEVGAAEADLFPSFSFGTSFGYESSHAKELLRWKNHLWSLTGEALWSLFDGGRRSAAIRYRHAMLQESLYRYQERLLTAVKEVEDSLTSLAETTLQLECTERRWREASELARVIGSRFDTGLVDQIPLLLSSLDEISTQQQLLDVRMKLTDQYITVFKSLGGVVRSA